MKGLSKFPKVSLTLLGRLNVSHSKSWCGAYGSRPMVGLVGAMGKELWVGEGTLKSSDVLPSFPLDQNPGGGAI